MDTATLIDPRIAELEALATEEGIVLPMPIETILWFEDRGKLVDLATGAVYDIVAVQPTQHAKSVAYLLAEVDGDVLLNNSL